MGRAFQRINAAATDADFEDELSCLLHHFYRFSEFCWKRLGYADRGKFFEWLHQSGDPDLRAAGAMTWARNFDTHRLLVMATPTDTYSDIYGDIYGAPVWKTRPPETDKKWKRHEDYEAVLDGREVVTTIRSAFDATVALLSPLGRSPAP
jgi:hypothetical protein